MADLDLTAAIEAATDAALELTEFSDPPTTMDMVLSSALHRTAEAAVRAAAPLIEAAVRAGATKVEYRIKELPVDDGDETIYTSWMFSDLDDLEKWAAVRLDESIPWVAERQITLVDEVWTRAEVEDIRRRGSGRAARLQELAE